MSNSLFLIDSVITKNLYDSKFSVYGNSRIGIVLYQFFAQYHPALME